MSAGQVGRPAGGDLREEVERALGRVDPGLRQQFRQELAKPFPLVPKSDERSANTIRLAMLDRADGNLARLRSARRLADTDWRDLLVGSSEQTTAFWTPPRNRLADRIEPDHVVFVGVAARGAEALRFIGPADGRVTDVAFERFLDLTPRHPLDDHPLDDHPLSVRRGDWGRLVTDGEHTLFEVVGRAELWEPGGYQVAERNTVFRPSTRKGHAIDRSADVEAALVLDDRNLASRFAEAGHLLVGDGVVGFVAGASVADWCRANVPGRR